MTFEIPFPCPGLQDRKYGKPGHQSKLPTEIKSRYGILTPDRQLWSGISVAVETANSVLCRHACVHHACTCIESFGCTIECMIIELPSRGGAASGLNVWDMGNYLKDEIALPNNVHVTMKTVGRRIQEAQYDQYCH
uniref:Uncharacterized protein n=1 Tax=Oryza rufipogon TaxID=4529 RepID=A0A0E0N6D5_ORYRU